MATKKYHLNVLSRKSIEKLKKDLTEYRNGLKGKTKLLVERLAQIGFQTASARIGESPLGHYVSLRIDVGYTPVGTKAVLIATGEVKESDEYAPFNTLLAIEFGAGIYHNKERNPKADELGFGPGTFPGQIHAFEDGWYYWDEEKQTWRYTHGVKATMPMYHADMDIIASIEKVAREVFK